MRGLPHELGQLLVDDLDYLLAVFGFTLQIYCDFSGYTDMALGVALATVRGARIVEVPENGHTSLNPPLGPDRGGALTTRSTHPRTFARLNAIVAALGLDVEVGNPHGDKTKGELVALANAAAPGDFAAGVSDTLSCAKLNGNYYKGGNPNYACGLCVAACPEQAISLARV